jgi:flagella basal body P-ring formation protein FlgA
VSAELIRLEVGTVPADWPAEGEARVSLLGSGAGGHWVARVESGPPESPASMSVRVRAGVLVRSPVAAHALERGHLIAPEDVRLAEVVRWGEPGPEPLAVIDGWETQRVIAEGEALRPPAVDAPLMVRSGDAIRIVWRRGGLELAVPGQAAGSARLGRTARVRTAEGRSLTGVAVAPGIVDVSRKEGQP